MQILSVTGQNAMKAGFSLSGDSLLHKFLFFILTTSPPKILLANVRKHIKKHAAFRIASDLCKGVMTSLSTKACWKAAGSCSYKH